MRLLPIPVARGPVHADLRLPGSKSITNRALLAAALADGESLLEHALYSEDTRIFAECLRRLGIEVIEDEAAATFRVHGRGGALDGAPAELWVGNAGTAARFITALLALGRGPYRVDGVPAMRKRPMAELLEILERQGARVRFEGQAGHVPFSIEGAGGLEGGEIEMEAARTSQQASALLLVAPYARQNTKVHVTGTLVSPSYVEMTLRLMADWGVDVVRDGPTRFTVPAGGRYTARRYGVEPDASSASYFFAAAAVTGGTVRVRGLSSRSLQGDVRFVDVLEAMGCAVERADDWIEVRGPERLRGVEVDMNDVSDTAPTLAAIAPFASGPVAIRNVEHMRWKETDRVLAVATELRRMGVSVDERRDGLTIHPGPVSPAEVHTYDDHRIAMAFSVTGVRAPGIVIRDPDCVGKTFERFYDFFFGMLDGVEPA
ncbi:MAG: aroA, 3-phosphoshikimate 1-carboxyvinyltransferase [Gemmatimonadetes bacterium]|nr:aroA, 3-phosphoshikimate 1-carboxyvinyltransferase [Gemmatimonadota bacterium]